MLQQPIAVKVISTGGETRSWVSIIVARPPHLYCVNDEMFDASLLAMHSPHGDEDLALVKSARYYANDLAQLYEILHQLEVDPESFDAPWHVNHPLF